MEKDIMQVGNELEIVKREISETYKKVKLEGYSKSKQTIENKEHKYVSYYNITEKYRVAVKKKYLGEYSTLTEAYLVRNWYANKSNLNSILDTDLDFPLAKQFEIGEKIYSDYQTNVKSTVIRETKSNNNSKSKFIGVTKPKGNMYVTNFRHNGKGISIFSSSSEVQCAMAYNVFRYDINNMRMGLNPVGVCIDEQRKLLLDILKLRGKHVSKHLEYLIN